MATKHIFQPSSSGFMAVAGLILTDQQRQRTSFPQTRISRIPLFEKWSVSDGPRSQLDMPKVTQLLSTGDQDWTPGSQVTQASQTPNQELHPQPPGLGSSLTGSSAQPSGDTGPTGSGAGTPGKQAPSPSAVETGLCEYQRGVGAKQDQVKSVTGPLSEGFPRSGSLPQ